MVEVEDEELPIVMSSRPTRPPTGIIDLRQQLRKRIAKVKQRNLTALQCFNDGLRTKKNGSENLCTTVYSGTGVVQHETGNVEKLSEIIIIINLCAPLASMLFTVSIIFILASRVFLVVYIRYSCHSLRSNQSFKIQVQDKIYYRRWACGHVPYDTL